MPRITTIAAPLAHLVGPGKIKVINGRLAFSTGDGAPLRLDPTELHTVYCYGPVGVTDDAMQVLFAHDVAVAWLTPAGSRCRGRLVRSDPSRTTLRLLQHRALADAAGQRDWAAQVVTAKIDSQVAAARHYQRQGHAAAGGVLRQFQAAREQCPSATLDQLRGLEGTASAAWFGLLGQVLVPAWSFTLRTRRPPRDPINALLSLGYTWLLSRVIARCDAVGLEVNLGGLHDYRPGRPSLACDLMEPFRVPAVDRWVVSICNQGQISAGDFRPDDGGIYLQQDRFPKILHAWEDYWRSQELEIAFDSWIEEFTRWLRQWDPVPVGPEDAAPDDL